MRVRTALSRLARLLRGCAPISQHLQRLRWAMVPLRQPSSGVPGPTEVCLQGVASAWSRGNSYVSHCVSEGRVNLQTAV